MGEANGEPFLFVVGVGFDAETVRHFEARDRSWGPGSLILPVLYALLHDADRPLQATTPRVSRPAWVIVTRAKHYVANLPLAPQADLHSPHFYVICAAGAGRLTRMRQLSALLTNMLRYNPAVTIEATQQVRIEGDPKTPVQIDGESKAALPMRIRLRRARLHLILPAS